MEIFHRTSLAEELATHILDDDLAPASSGLFLGARRRIGKSTFLQQDLCPELRRRGAVVIYADLWDNRDRDPGDVIIDAIREELAHHEGVVLRFARAAGMEKVSVGGVSFTMDRVGLGREVSLSKALAMLSDESKRMIVLIVDEAQHALTTEKGSNSLYALKAARDRLNMGPHHGLRIVATGSNPDKLAVLVEWKDQAFFCAPLREFPAMGADYLRWLVGRAPTSAGLSIEFLDGLFRRSGCRPEWMQDGLSAIAHRNDWTEAEARRVFADTVESHAQMWVNKLLGMVGLLSPLQSAVLRVLAAQGQRFVPFWTRTMETYRLVIELDDGNEATEPINIQTVQEALETLRKKGFLWCSVHGAYALEEFGIKEALEEGGLLTESTQRVTRMGRHPALSAEALE